MATSTIACNCSSIGQFGKLLIEPSGTAPRTFTSGSERVEFVYEKIGTKRALQFTNSITGTPSRFITGVREHSYLTQGVIAVQASPANLALWFPRIFGGTQGAEGTGTGTDVDSDGKDRNYSLGNTLPSFDALVYREAGIFQYTNLKVAQALLRGKTSNGGEGNEFIELIIVVIGEQEIITQSGGGPWPATEPSLPNGVVNLPYAYWESKLFLNSIELDSEEFTLIVDNQLSVKFFNHKYPTCVRSTGRTVTLNAKLPFTCSGLAQSLLLNTTTGTAEIRLATPSTVTFHSSVRLPYARSTFNTPVIEGKQDIPLDISVEGYSSAGNDEAVVTNDHAT